LIHAVASASGFGVVVIIRAKALWFIIIIEVAGLIIA
jgi:hypothetical protein